MICRLCSKNATTKPSPYDCCYDCYAKIATDRSYDKVDMLIRRNMLGPKPFDPPRSPLGYDDGVMRMDPHVRDLCYHRDCNNEAIEDSIYCPKHLEEHHFVEQNRTV